MTENPYDILGVPRGASLDEVKKAYRKKARENHPDLNPNDPQAAQRMNKVNEAYDRIVNPEKYTAADARARAREASSTGAAGAGVGQRGTQGGQQGWNAPGGGQAGYAPYDWVDVDWDDLFGGGWGQAGGAIHPEASPADAPDVRAAIDAINRDDFRRATAILSAIPSGGRNARWHYLAALADKGNGNMVGAYDHIRRARQKDPANAEYQRAEQMFAHGASDYEQQSQGWGFSTVGVSPFAFCLCLSCAPAFYPYCMFCC